MAKKKTVAAAAPKRRGRLPEPSEPITAPHDQPKPEPVADEPEVIDESIDEGYDQDAGGDTDEETPVASPQGFDLEAFRDLIRDTVREVIPAAQPVRDEPSDSALVQFKTALSGIDRNDLEHPAMLDALSGLSAWAESLEKRIGAASNETRAQRIESMIDTLDTDLVGRTGKANAAQAKARKELAQKVDVLVRGYAASGRRVSEREVFDEAVRMSGLTSNSNRPPKPAPTRTIPPQTRKTPPSTDPVERATQAVSRKLAHIWAREGGS